MTLHRVIGVWLRVVLIVAGVVLVGVVWGCGGYIGPAPTPFNSEAWRTCDPTTNDLRFRMAPSLLRDHRLVGRTAVEVQELLGHAWTVEQDEQRSCHHYFLGPERPEWGSWGYPFLTVEVIQGRVSRVYHLAGMGAVAEHAPRQR